MVDPEVAAELRRLANLFLVSGITLLLFLVRAFAEVFTVTFIPRPVYVVWGIAMLTGWAMTYVYGVFVTFKARRWAWFALCAIPFTCVPAAAAYAWIRRQEIEREVLGDERAPATPAARAARRSAERLRRSPQPPSAARRHHLPRHRGGAVPRRAAPRRPAPRDRALSRHALRPGSSWPSPSECVSLLFYSLLFRRLLGLLRYPLTSASPCASTSPAWPPPICSRPAAWAAPP